MTITRKTLAGLAAVFTIVLTTTVMIGMAADRRLDDQLRRAQVTSSSTSTPSSGHSSDAHSDHVLDDLGSASSKAEADWRPVVEAFGRNFSNTVGGAEQWRARLAGPAEHPYITSGVADQLATVNPTNVPQGRYGGYTPVHSSAYEIAVKVSYQEGWALELRLITDGTRWQIHAYDRWAR